MFLAPNRYGSERNEEEEEEEHGAKLTCRAGKFDQEHRYSPASLYWAELMNSLRPFESRNWILGWCAVVVVAVEPALCEY